MLRKSSLEWTEKHHKSHPMSKVKLQEEWGRASLTISLFYPRGVFEAEVCDHLRAIHLHFCPFPNPCPTRDLYPYLDDGPFQPTRPCTDLEGDASCCGRVHFHVHGYRPSSCCSPPSRETACHNDHRCCCLDSKIACTLRKQRSLEQLFFRHPGLLRLFPIHERESIHYLQNK